MWPTHQLAGLLVAHSLEPSLMNKVFAPPISIHMLILTVDFVCQMQEFLFLSISMPLEWNSRLGTTFCLDIYLEWPEM